MPIFSSHCSPHDSSLLGLGEGIRVVRMEGRQHRITPPGPYCLAPPPTSSGLRSCAWFLRVLVKERSIRQQHLETRV